MTVASLALTIVVDMGFINPWVILGFSFWRDVRAR